MLWLRDLGSSTPWLCCSLEPRLSSAFSWQKRRVCRRLSLPTGDTQNQSSYSTGKNESHGSRPRTRRLGNVEYKLAGAASHLCHKGTVVKNASSRAQRTWIQTPVLPLTSHVDRGTLCHLWDAFLLCKMGIMEESVSQVCHGVQARSCRHNSRHSAQHLVSHQQTVFSLLTVKKCHHLIQWDVKVSFGLKETEAYTSFFS